ncbi:hypothetical protein [Paenibacillus sp. FSL W8-0194]|uniref:hypothetical protein n=1 Tax=Paenibacillus sp. FSL W8-0194 TaxID=2921711 RepID=UPI0030DB6989
MLLSVSLVAAMFTLPLSAFADPTIETPSFYLPPGKKPTLTLVPYPYSGGSIPGNCDVYYTLVDVATNNWISGGVRISKNYTSTNFFYTFNNVLAGTYIVVISNYPSAYAMKGNEYFTL